MSKYRQDDDLLTVIRNLESRLSRLERTPQLPSTSIDSDGFVVEGGSIVVRNGPDATVDGGEILLDGHVNTVFGQGVGLYIKKDPTVGVGIFNPYSMTVRGIDDGVGGLQTGTYPSLAIYDKAGNTLISDCFNQRHGFGEPKLSYTWWNSADIITTTSASFTDLAQTYWYMYHPALRVTVLSNNDATTTGELRVLDLLNSNNVVVNPITTPANTQQFNDIFVDRMLCTDGDGQNGKSAWLAIQHRRASGAGNARAMVVGMVGLDLL